ncbi:tyrosine-type recombinase/integrase [Patescibacteria group bacterium]|nr:tyrosine-type recombinase/integrase [Patescibacteria group bacterium]
MQYASHPLPMRGQSLGVGVMDPKRIGIFLPNLDERSQFVLDENQPLVLRNQEAKNLFLERLQSDECSKHTISSYHHALKIFLDWLENTGKSIVGMLEQDFVDYEIYLSDKRKLKSTTKAHYFSSIRNWWVFLLKRGMVNQDVSIIPAPKRRGTEHYPYVEEQEIEILLNSFSGFFPVDIRNKAIISLMYATGVRLGELISLDLSSIDTEKMKGNVKTFKSRKDNPHRDVYWDTKTNDILLEWLSTRERLIQTETKVNSNALFISLATQSYGKRIGKDAIQKLFREKREELGIDKKISAHSLRHGFGHKGVEKNIHPRHLQLMLGHEKLETTMGYMGCANKEVEDAYRKKMIG